MNIIFYLFFYLLLNSRLFYYMPLQGMTGIMNGLLNGCESLGDLKQTQQEILSISDYSSRLERILLTLLNQQKATSQALEEEKKEREDREKEIMGKIGETKSELICKMNVND